MALVGGRWFDGAKFVVRTVYAVGHDLSATPPKTITKTFQLAGQFIVPPFGDAHTHHFDNPNATPGLVSTYLHEGCYAKVLTEPRSGASRTASLVNRHDSVDVAYGHAGLTSSFSHPIEVYEAMALGMYSYELVIALDRLQN